MDIINSLLKTGNKTANINVKNCSLYTLLTATDRNHKMTMLTTFNIDIQAILVWLTLPFYDFCGFWPVAINNVYKLQFFTFISH